MSRFTAPFGFHSTAAEVIAGIDLTGKRAIITGGAAGIGIETARALSAAGAAVMRASHRARCRATDMAALYVLFSVHKRALRFLRTPQLTRVLPHYLVSPPLRGLGRAWDFHRIPPMSNRASGYRWSP
jgi:hypothetical protein